MAAEHGMFSFSEINVKNELGVKITAGLKRTELCE